MVVTQPEVRFAAKVVHWPAAFRPAQGQPASEPRRSSDRSLRYSRWPPCRLRNRIAIALSSRLRTAANRLLPTALALVGHASGCISGADRPAKTGRRWVAE